VCEDHVLSPPWIDNQGHGSRSMFRVSDGARKEGVHRVTVT